MAIGEKETQPAGNITLPPRAIEAVVQWLTPKSSRKHILGDLSESYVCPRQYVRHASRVLLSYVAGQVRRSFNVRLVAAEACGLIVCFAGFGIALPLLVVFAFA